MAELEFSEGHALPDGRKVRLLTYDDGSIRVRLNGGPYVMEEAFITSTDQVNIKLVPRGVSLNQQAEPDESTLRERADALLTMLKAAHQNEAADDQPGKIKRRHERSAVISALTVLMMDDAWTEPPGDDEARTNQTSPLSFKAAMAKHGEDPKAEVVQQAVADMPEVFFSWDVIDAILPEHPNHGSSFPVKVGMHLAKHQEAYGIVKEGSSGARGQRWRKVVEDS